MPIKTSVKFALKPGAEVISSFDHKKRKRESSSLTAEAATVVEAIGADKK